MAGQKILISKRGCIIRRVNFLKGALEIFGENGTLHICSIVNNQKHALQDSICTKVN